MICVYIGSKWTAIKASVIHGDIPLLVSRPALASLGLVLDLGANTAIFRKLGSGDLPLRATPSGHPAVCVKHDGHQPPDMSFLPKSWENHGVAVLSPREVYMVGNVERTAHHGMDSLLHDQYPRIFYAKKLDPAVSVMLTADVLNPEAFLSWWSRTGLTQDFWIETNDKLVRVHLVPRKSFFDPRKWQSKAHSMNNVNYSLGPWGV